MPLFSVKDSASFQVFNTVFAAEVAKRRKNDLERGEALLAVYDLTFFHVCRGRLLLVKHHRAQEMHWRVFSSVEVFGELARDIFPEWLPMPVLTPNVLALK